MQITSTTLRRIIKEELNAIMEEGVLDDIVGRKPSGAPMTAQARQDILDGYVAFVQDKMPNVSPEDAVKSAIDLFVAGGDPYLDRDSELFDQDLFDSLMGEEGAMNEAAPKSTHRGKVKNKKTGRTGMVSSARKDKLGLMMTVVYRDGETPKQETVYASDLEVV